MSTVSQDTGSESSVVVTCEHGGNRVPARYEHLFSRSARTLASHRGWDPGALGVARILAQRLGAPLVAATVTRLLIDLNRPLDSPTLFSNWSRRLSERERERVIERYWRVHWQRVNEACAHAVQESAQVLHISVHTFTPKRQGERRTTDVGLLYDPARPPEVHFCKILERNLDEALHARVGPLTVHHNRPYLGSDPGLTSALRQRWPPERYVGIELEINQRFFRKPARRRGSLVEALCVAVARTNDET